LFYDLFYLEVFSILHPISFYSRISLLITPIVFREDGYGLPVLDGAILVEIEKDFG